MKKKRKLIKPVAVGFVVLYLIIMGLTTYLTAEKFAEEYEQMHSIEWSYLYNEISDKENGFLEDKDTAEKSSWYQSVINGSTWVDGRKYVNLSAALYDEEGNLLARRRNTVGGYPMATADTESFFCKSFALDERLSPEDIDRLARYQYEANQWYEREEPPRYRLCIRVSDDGQELYEILVQYLTWEPGDDAWNKGYEDPLLGGRYGYTITPDAVYGSTESSSSIGNVTWYETDSQIIFDWSAKESEDPEHLEGQYMEANEDFPYLSGGYEKWKRWNESVFLNDFPVHKDIPLWEEEKAEVKMSYRLFHSESIIRERAWQSDDGEKSLNLEVRMEGYPWLAAMDYTKYVYLAGAVLMLACMIKIIYSANQVYDRQEALEETRKDFINAMAHELKTPLGIIRNFAENLQEHIMEEKQDYYLGQIVGQTEEMDALVGEMILVSRMDTKDLVFPEESVSIYSLIKEQLKRLQPIIEEQHIRVEMCCEEDFLVEGDQGYLAKAVWNLLSNAADYNREGGFIQITVTEESCTIENTGEPLSEEQLSHAFDLFYSEDKSRFAQNRHMGMGLYLAKKILERHKLTITLENTELGVRAAILREGRRRLL